MPCADIQPRLNWYGRIQNILATYGYEKTDWFFNMVLYVFMVKVHKTVLKDEDVLNPAMLLCAVSCRSLHNVLIPLIL